MAKIVQEQNEMHSESIKSIIRHKTQTQIDSNSTLHRNTENKMWKNIESLETLFFVFDQFEFFSEKNKLSSINNIFYS